MDIGLKIKKLREKKNLTQEQLALEIGVSKNTILAYESHNKHPKIEILERLSQLFGVHISDFFIDESRQVTEAKEPNIEYGKKSRDLGELDRLFDRTKKLEDRLKAAEEEKLSSGDKVEQLEKIVNDQMALIEKLQFNVDRHEDYLKAISKGMLSRDVKAKDETGKESSEPKGKVG